MYDLLTEFEQTAGKIKLLIIFVEAKAEIKSPYKTNAPTPINHAGKQLFWMMADEGGRSGGLVRGGVVWFGLEEERFFCSVGTLKFE